MSKQSITQIAGAILVVWGLGLAWLPLGFIVAGAALIAGPLMYDPEDEDV